MTGITITQVTRVYDVAVVMAADRESVLKFFTTVDAVDHVLEVDRLISIKIESFRHMAGVAILRIVPGATMECQVGVATFAVVVVNHRSPGRGDGIGDRKHDTRILCVVALLGHHFTKVNRNQVPAFNADGEGAFSIQG